VPLRTALEFIKRFLGGGTNVREVIRARIAATIRVTFEIVRNGFERLPILVSLCDQTFNNLGIAGIAMISK
jgi:hypothetical protein